MDALLALLIAFPDLPMPAQVPPGIHAALVDFATRHDLSTPAEGWKGYPFDKGIRWTAFMLRELADAPPSCDHWRFPPPEWCEVQLAANRAYQHAVTAWGDFASWRWQAAQAAIGEAARRERMWEAALGAARAFSVSERRRCLARLKEGLGAEAYYAGRMPAPLPD